MPLRRERAFALLIAAASVSGALAASVRDYTRLVTGDGAAVSQTQASELTLTLTDAAVRPIQTWVRTAAPLGQDGRTLIAVVTAAEGALVRPGQRLRAFSLDARAQMHQGKVMRVTALVDGYRIEAALADLSSRVGVQHVMEIVADRGSFLSVPNVALIEESDAHVVYVQGPGGRFQPRTIHTGWQGELYVQVLDGLEAGDQVVSIGSFFVDAEYKLKGPGGE